MGRPFKFRRGPPAQDSTDGKRGHAFTFFRVGVDLCVWCQKPRAQCTGTAPVTEEEEEARIAAFTACDACTMPCADIGERDCALSHDEPPEEH